MKWLMTILMCCWAAASVGQGVCNPDNGAANRIPWCGLDNNTLIVPVVDNGDPNADFLWLYLDGQTNATPKLLDDAGTNDFTFLPSYAGGPQAVDVGKDGPAYFFDNLDDRCLGPKDWPDSTSFTFNVWFNQPSFSVKTRSLFSSFGGGGGNRFLLRHVTQTVQFYVYDSSGNFALADKAAYGSDPTNQWIMLTATYDGSAASMKVYTNAVDLSASVAAGSFTPPINTNAAIDMNWGVRNGTSTPYEGHMYDVRIYSNAIDQAGITWLYENTAPGDIWEDPNESLMLAHWDMQTTNATGFDEIQNSYNATSMPSVGGGPSRYIVGTNENGRVEYAYSFDNSDDYFEAVPVWDTNITNIAGGGWVNPDTITGSDVLFSQAESGAASDLRLLCYRSGGAVEVRIYDGNTGGYIGRRSGGGATLVTGVWQHVSFDYDSSGATADDKVNIYFNGEAVDTADATSGSFTNMNTNTGITFEIGSWQGGNLLWEGDLYDAVYYTNILGEAAWSNRYDNTHPTNNIEAR